MRGQPRLIKLVDKQGKLKSPYWYIAYIEEGRDRRCSTGRKIGEEDHAANFALAVFTLAKQQPIREPDKLMVAQALQDYYEEHAKFIATAKHAEYHEKRLNVYFKGYFVSGVTQARIDAYVRERQALKESNGTIRRDLEHLQAAFNHEVTNSRLTHAPKFRKPAPPPPRERYLTEEEIKKLISHCKSEHVKNFVTLMVNTGQRPEAVQSLTWFQIDFKERIIHFERTGKAQTNKRVRPVAMNQTVYMLLKALHKARQTEFVLEYCDIITGEVRKAGNVKKAFERACKAAGLENVSRYTLRHTFANRLDADDKTIGDIMGHTTAKTTQTHYIKSKMEKQREALERMGKKK